MTQFEWTSKRESAALALASGHTDDQAAQAAGVSRSSITRWKRDAEFSAEVDRLSLMVDIAGRAERLRVAMRAVRQKIGDDGSLQTDKDVLDWLKFAQSETDGLRLGLDLKLKQHLESELDSLLDVAQRTLPAEYYEKLLSAVSESGPPDDR